MKLIKWSKTKDRILKSQRGIGFQDIVDAMNSGGLLDTFKHPNQKKYPHQNMYIVETNNYVYVVPFVEDNKKIFLKTIYPSRDYKKLYSKV